MPVVPAAAMPLSAFRKERPRPTMEARRAGCAVRKDGTIWTRIAYRTRIGGASTTSCGYRSADGRSCTGRWEGNSYISFHFPLGARYGGVARPYSFFSVFNDHPHARAQGSALRDGGHRAQPQAGGIRGGERAGLEALPGRGVAGRATVPEAGLSGCRKACKNCDGTIPRPCAASPSGAAATRFARARRPTPSRSRSC